MEIISVSLILFSVIDVLGAIPAIVDFRRKLDKIESDILRKVFGVVLLAIAVKLFKTNLAI